MKRAMRTHSRNTTTYTLWGQTLRGPSPGATALRARVSAAAPLLPSGGGQQLTPLLHTPGSFLMSTSKKSLHLSLENTFKRMCC